MIGQNDFMPYVKNTVRRFFEEYETVQTHWKPRLVGCMGSSSSHLSVDLPVFIFHVPPETRKIFLGYGVYDMPFAHQYFLFSYAYQSFYHTISPCFYLSMVAHCTRKETDLSHARYSIGLPLPNINSGNGICMGAIRDLDDTGPLQLVEHVFGQWWSRRFNCDYASYMAQRPAFWMALSKADPQELGRLVGKETARKLLKYLSKFAFNQFDSAYLQSRLIAKGIDFNAVQLFSSYGDPEGGLALLGNTLTAHPDIWTDSRICGKQAGIPYIGSVVNGPIPLSDDFDMIKQQAFETFGITAPAPPQKTYNPSFWKKPFGKR